MPEHSVRLSGFWMQQHEVTNAEYQRFVRSHSFPNGQERYQVVQHKAGWKPARTLHGGAVGCRRRLNRSTPPAGQRGARYPWGDKPAPTCDLAQYDGCNPTASRFPVMSKPNGKTPEGIYDLAGNVLEWVADWKGPFEPRRGHGSQGPEM